MSMNSPSIKGAFLPEKSQLFYLDLMTGGRHEFFTLNTEAINDPYRPDNGEAGRFTLRSSVRNFPHVSIPVPCTSPYTLDSYVTCG